MQKISQNVMGITAFRPAPSSIEEFQSLSGGKILEYANDEAYYRGIAPKVRTAYLSKIEKSFGLSPRVTGTKTVGTGENAKTVDVFEKDTSFIKFVRASGITAEQLTPLLQESFDEVGWDISSTRSTGPNKKDLEMAEFYCQQAESNPDTSWDKIVANFERLNPGLEIPREDDGSVTLEAMAIAVKVNRTRVEAETLI
jgi:hypothetical protein